MKSIKSLSASLEAEDLVWNTGDLIVKGYLKIVSQGRIKKKLYPWEILSKRWIQWS